MEVIITLKNCLSCSKTALKYIYQAFFLYIPHSKCYMDMDILSKGPINTLITVFCLLFVCLSFCVNSLTNPSHSCTGYDVGEYDELYTLCTLCVLVFS